MPSDGKSVNLMLFLPGIGAAMLFGLSTPLNKIITDEIHPLLLSGLIYGTAGLFLISVFILLKYFRNRTLRGPGKEEFPFFLNNKEKWLFSGIVLSGSIIAPFLLLAGIDRIAASRASLLLNFEIVFTVSIAMVLFHERLSRYGYLGSILAIIGFFLINTTMESGSGISSDGFIGESLILFACLFWGIDNNLTQKMSDKNPLQLAGLKGILGGSISILSAILLRIDLSVENSSIPIFLFIGIMSIGISLVLFIYSLRNVGTVKTGLLFSSAPIFGILFSFIIHEESFRSADWIASIMIFGGILLIIWEKHQHSHIHQELRHSHAHTHDVHHSHEHHPPQNDNAKNKSHEHPHFHTALSHVDEHSHDIHHRHRH